MNTNSTIKVSDKVKDRLDELKRLINRKSYNSVLEELIVNEMKKYCYTSSGYAGIGDNLLIDGVKYKVKAINGETVFVVSRKDKIIEFHKNGKIAWQAEIVVGDPYEG